MLLLRLVHILGGVFWAGSVMLTAWFVVPTARQIGPASGPFMQALLKRRFPDVLVVAGLITVGAGIWLWAIRMPGFVSWRDWALAIGAIAGLVGVLFGMIWQRPAALKLQRLGVEVAAGGGPPTAEQGAQLGQLQTRLANYASILSVFVVIAVAGMALGG